MDNPVEKQANVIRDPSTKEIPKVQYSPEELAYRSALIGRLCNARDLREQHHPELDGMTYTEYYESNRRTDLSYIPPKVNKQDTRVVTGTTREKDTTLLSTLLNLNLAPDITAFDTDDMVVAELGDNMSDLVHKSREVENWQKKRPIIYRELISQGDVFVEEIYVKDFRNVPLSDLEWDPEKDSVSDLSFKERLTEVFCGPSARMVNGKKVYLGNIRTEYIEDQPLVAIMNILPRAKAESIYSKWERWKNVPQTVETLTAFETDGITYKDWNMTSVAIDQVAEIKIFLPFENRFMIMLNGVMMLPINYPMTAISPSGEVPISQGKLEPISDFSYSKSQPSKTKVDQAVIDEMTMLMIEAMRQTRKPPMGNTTKKVYGSNIFMAGKITSDVKKDQLFSLMPAGTGQINQSEFSFYQLIKKSIDEKSINANYEGAATEKAQTAYEVDTLKQQQMLKLGLSMDGVVNLERRMTWNRIYNILANSTKEFDLSLPGVRKSMEEKYKSLSVNTTLENGEKGIKIFRFQDGEYPDVREQEQEEHNLTKKHRKQVRIVYMNPRLLRTMKFIWFIIINPTPKSNDKLSQLLFVQNITTAMKIFGPESMNMEYVKQRFAILTNEDYNKFFKKMDVMTMMQQGIRPTGVQQKNIGKEEATDRTVLRAAME